MKMTKPQFSRTLVQINFDYAMPRAEFETLADQAAPLISPVDGLLWKIFLVGHGSSDAGGIYLFENDTAAEAYLNGPIIANLRQHPGITNVTVRRSAILKGPTDVTRGPIEAQSLMTAG